MRSPRAGVGPQVLRLALEVVGDHRVGGVEDRLRAAVVLVEHDRRDVGERILELQDVAEVGAAELVDAVVHEHAVGDVRVRRRRPRGRTPAPRTARTTPRRPSSTASAPSRSTSTSMPGCRCDDRHQVVDRLRRWPAADGCRARRAAATRFASSSARRVVLARRLVPHDCGACRVAGARRPTSSRSASVDPVRRPLDAVVADARPCDRRTSSG